MTGDLERLEKMLALIPHRITTTTEATAAMNGYGVIHRHECVVETEREICIHCKVPASKITDSWCPANGEHVFKYAWIKEAGGAGFELKLAIQKAIEALEVGQR